jgi:hypothetical protein
VSGDAVALHQLLRELFETLGAARHENDVATVLSGEPRELQTDPAGGSGDESRPAPPSVRRGLCPSPRPSRRTSAKGLSKKLTSGA